MTEEKTVKRKVEVDYDEYAELITEHTVLRIGLINGLDEWEHWEKTVEQAKDIILKSINKQTEKVEQCLKN